MHFRSLRSRSALVSLSATALAATPLLIAACVDTKALPDERIASQRAPLEVGAEPGVDDNGDIDVGDDPTPDGDDPIPPQCPSKGVRKGWGPNTCENPHNLEQGCNIEPTVELDKDGNPVYMVELNRFMLQGRIGIGQCNINKPRCPEEPVNSGEVPVTPVFVGEDEPTAPEELRPLVGGTAPVRNTNLTAFDFGGTDFDALRGNTIVDAKHGTYSAMLQRFVTINEVNEFIDYRFEGVSWEYQASLNGKKRTWIAPPVPTSPANPFQAPATGDHNINLVRTDFVSVRLQVRMQVPDMRISALRFRALADDHTASGRFVSDEDVDGSIVNGSLSPDPASVGGFVSTWDDGHNIVTGEVLVPRGKSYTFDDGAVEFTDFDGKPLSVVALPLVKLDVPDACGIYTASVDVTVPEGRLTGSAFFQRDPNEPSSSGPRVKHYSVPYLGADDKNAYNRERAGFDIHGRQRLYHSSGNSAVSYDYRAIKEGRWGLSVCNPGPVASLEWPSGAKGFYRWPAPGHDAINPVDWNDGETRGLDRDGFTFVNDEDSDWAVYDPALPFPLLTETINLVTPMAYLKGAIELNGCIGQTSIRSGGATISGVRQDDGLPEDFHDELLEKRRARTGNQGGAAKGVFLGGGNYEIAASVGPWKEGGYVVNLRRNLGDGAEGDYTGSIGVSVKEDERLTHFLAPGQDNALSAPTRTWRTGQMTALIKVRNQDGSLRPFRRPSAYVGSRNHPYRYGEDLANGNFEGTYYASSKGSATAKTEHLITLIGVAESRGNVRLRVLVPDDNGREHYMSYMIRNVPFNSDSCKNSYDECGQDADKNGIGDACEPVCVTIKDNKVRDTFVSMEHDTANFGAEQSLYVGTYAGPNYHVGFTRTLLDFDTSVVPTNATIVSAKLTLNGIASSDTDATVEAFVANQSWTESGVTWSNYQPLIDDDAALDAFASQVGPVSIHIEPEVFVDLMAAHGILLRQSKSLKHQAPKFTQYASSESATQGLGPQLELCYQNAPQ